jgi:hypothetical protein
LTLYIYKIQTRQATHREEEQDNLFTSGKVSYSNCLHTSITGEFKEDKRNKKTSRWRGTNGLIEKEIERQKGILTVVSGKEFPNHIKISLLKDII